MTWRQYLFSFDGRINRARIWKFYFVAWVIELVVFVTTILTYQVLSAAGATTNDALSGQNSILPGVAFTTVLAISFLALYYMYLAVLVKRLHDRNKSGRWVVTFFVIPSLLIFGPEILSATKPFHGNEPAKIAAIFTALFGMALYIWGFVELYCLRGMAGDNQYGPDPLAGRV